MTTAVVSSLSAKERTGPSSANQGVTKNRIQQKSQLLHLQFAFQIRKHNFCYATKTWPTVSVQASLMALLLNLDLDYLSAARTVSVICGVTVLRGCLLNLGLQCVGMMRKENA